MTASAQGTPTHVAPAPLRVALLGLGTVGLEVARALTGRADDLRRGAGGRPIRLVAVAERDAERFEQVDLRGVELAGDASDVIGRPDVDVVVELIGGVGIAGRLVPAALASSRHVVTANKALLASRGAELEALAREHEVALRFEASVGGAIPVLSPLATDLAANRFTTVRGIVNGSTNHVLTAMAHRGGRYDDVVAEAKGLGFLEADPSADVEGRDAADKLAILIRILFGAWPDVTAIRRAPPAVEGDGPAGITGVTDRLLEVAKRQGRVVKLVARAERCDDGRIVAFVLPCALSRDDPLAGVDYAENRIEVRGSPVGYAAFVGPGAGGAPTSSAVLGDILAIARGEGSTWGALPPAGALAPDRLVDGMDEPRAWLAADETRRTGRAGADRSGGGQTDTLSLDALRARLAAAGIHATFFPILEGR